MQESPLRLTTYVLGWCHLSICHVYLSDMPNLNRILQAYQLGTRLSVVPRSQNSLGRVNQKQSILLFL